MILWISSGLRLLKVVFGVEQQNVFRHFVSFHPLDEWKVSDSTPDVDTPLAGTRGSVQALPGNQQHAAKISAPFAKPINRQTG